MAFTDKAPSNATAAAPAATTADASNAAVATPAKTTTAAALAASATKTPTKFFKPKAQLDAVGRRIRMLVVPRKWDEYERIFTYVRNTKWGVSTINGVAVDIGNPDHQFHSQEQIRAATWTEVAKKFNIDIRGDNNQLWFTEPVIDEKTGNFMVDEHGDFLFREPLPVEGYDDVSLSAPQQNKKHWLEDLRPDLYKRWEGVVGSGGMVSLPKACTTEDLKGVMAMFEMDLNLAQNAIAAAKPKM